MFEANIIVSGQRVVVRQNNNLICSGEGPQYLSLVSNVTRDAANLGLNVSDVISGNMRIVNINEKTS